MIQAGSDHLIELGAPSLGAEEKQALCAVIDDGWITMGDRVRRFEQAFAKLQGVEDALAVGSATAALQLCMAAFDIGPGDEVIVPSLTFVATSNTVIRAGATPVFADIESLQRPVLALDDVARRITARTRAIIVVHYAGYLMDLEPWRALADAHNLLLFEDAAHIIAVEGPGLVSDGAAFSFFTNKNMTTAEGGMIVVRDAERRQRVKALRSHGMSASTLDRARGRAVGYDVVDCGYNFRMDELRAAMGLVQIERVSGWNASRRALVQRYRDLIGSAAPKVQVPFEPGDVTSAHIMPVLLPSDCDRQIVMARMREANIQTSVHYPAIHQFSYYRNAFPGIALPLTESFSERELTIPLHPKLSLGDLERVVGALAHALDS